MNKQNWDKGRESGKKANDRNIKKLNWDKEGRGLGKNKRL